MEAVHPLELLTRDGWCHVFLRVKSSEDVLAVANAHSLFHSIIATEREENWMSTLFYLTFSYFSDYLAQSDVLNLRLVKWIKPIIDNYLQQQKILAFTQPPFTIRLHEYIDNGIVMTLNTLLKEMRTLPIAKILTYTATYSYFEESYLDCLIFFREFGSQVTHLKIIFDFFDDFPPMEALKFLRNILDCVPNLTDLVLFFDCTKLDSGLPFDLWATDVEQMWTHVTPPTLPKLDAFETNVFPCEHDHVNPCFAVPVIRSILKAYSGQITYLDMDETSKPGQMIPAMPTLKPLRLELHNAEDVASLLDLQIPITRFCITPWDILQSVQSKQLFRALERFKDTLLEVEIYTNDWKLGRMRQIPLKVNLPLLRHLRLNGNFNGRIGSSFLFLENFPNLQTFELDLVKPNLLESDSSDDDATCSMETCLLSDSVMPDENNFYKSTIWKKLPDLKSVKVCIRPSKTIYLYPSFTRKGYESFQKNKLVTI